jgi:hypothetical protein
MESVNHKFSCLNGLTEVQKKQGDAIAGGNFENLLVEFQILRLTSGEKNRTASSINQFENSRAFDIRYIVFLNQEKLKESDPPIFDNSSPLDLEKLRRDPATPRELPGFLEKRFEIFGPTVISRFV